MASVHRRVPVLLVPSIVRLRVRAALADPAKLAEARRQMGFLLARTRPDADLDHFARRYLEEMAWRGDVRWHREMVVHQRIEGLEHLTTERDGSRGLVLNCMHHGQYVGSHTSMFLAGSPRINVVVHPRMFSADVPPFLEQHRRINEVGCRLHSREIGSKGIAGLLRGREIVSIASDAPTTNGGCSRDPSSPTSP
jgi:hypothetical protein